MARLGAAQLFSLLSERGAEIITPASLRRRLASGRRLRVKLGIDPTSPQLHLGHMVPLLMLRAFQDAGHRPVLIIGDFTARIGDPSGQAQARVALSPAEVRRNARTYLAQMAKIINLRKAEVRHNREWFSRMRLADFLGLLAKFSLRRAFEREDFQKRLAAGREVHLHEALYSVLQAYDSVAVRADVEIGSLDQRLNLLAGRELQSKLGHVSQEIILVPYLIGLDGQRKMSKTFSNHIALTATAGDMFGKVMRIPDRLIPHYARLAAWMETGQVREVERRLRRGDNPRDVKLDVAGAVVLRYHTTSAAKQAREEFLRVFSRRELPRLPKVVRLARRHYRPVELLVALGAVSSRSQARRLLKGRAVRLDGQTLDPSAGELRVQPGSIVGVGRRRFYRIG